MRPLTPDNRQPQNDENHYYGALKELAAARRTRAIKRDYIEVFIAHRIAHSHAAKAIQTIFEQYGEINNQQKVRVFLSEQIQAGEMWRPSLEQHLDSADWFFLLFPDKREDWSWCHEEAGFFRGITHPEVKKLIVFYHPEASIPDPLRPYQAVSCTDKAQIESFLELFFGGEPYEGFPPINSSFAKGPSIQERNNRADAVDLIMQAVRECVIDQIPTNNEIVIRIPDIKTFQEDITEDGVFPPNTKIVFSRTTPETCGLWLFGVPRRKEDYPWQEFIDRQLVMAVDEKSKESVAVFWQVFSNSCRMACLTYSIKTVPAKFHSHRTNINYIPVISNVEICGDNSAFIHIMLFEHVFEDFSRVSNKNLGILMTGLRLSNRFRWEIIDRYRKIDQLTKLVNENASKNREKTIDSIKKRVLHNIFTEIGALESEARLQGIYDPENLPLVFGPPESAEARWIENAFKEWERLRENLSSAANEGSLENFVRQLELLLPLNGEFIARGCRRVAEMLELDVNIR